MASIIIKKTVALASVKKSLEKPGSVQIWNKSWYPILYPAPLTLTLFNNSTS